MRWVAKSPARDPEVVRRASERALTLYGNDYEKAFGYLSSNLEAVRKLVDEEVGRHRTSIPGVYKHRLSGAVVNLQMAEAHLPGHRVLPVPAVRPSQ